MYKLCIKKRGSGLGVRGWGLRESIIRVSVGLEEKGSDVGDFLDADTAHRMSKFWTNLAWERPVRKTLPKPQSSDGV